VNWALWIPWIIRGAVLIVFAVVLRLTWKLIRAKWFPKRNVDSQDRPRKTSPRRKQAAAREQRDEAPSETRTLVATVAAVVVSVTVALPAQALWFLDRMVGRDQHGHLNIGVDPQTLIALAAPVLVEGLTWLSAILYADSVKTPGGTQRTYRLTTVAFSLIAASINFSHGVQTNFVVGLVFAMASLMGVGAWELYMMRSRHISSGMSSEEMKLWALRWRKHPKVMREVGRIRATFGVQVPREVAWRMAYVRRIGNPTVPVVVSDDLIERIFVSTVETAPAPDQTPPDSAVENASAESSDTANAEPEIGTGGGGIATAEVIELPVGWSAVNSVDDVIARFWPEVQAELDRPDSSADASSGARSELRPSSGSKPSSASPEQRVTSKVPTGKRNSTRDRNSGRVQLPPTKAELEGSGNAQERILRYLARAEAKGHSIKELDRKYIEQQFRVSDRHVRNAINAHKEGNQ